MEFERIADKKRLDFIVASLRNNLPGGGEVLDVGCGNGLITYGIGAAGFAVLGVDTSEESISRAIAYNTSPNIEFKVMAAEELGRAFRHFDAVVCSEVLEHLPNPGELLATIHSLLTNEGILLVTVPNGRGPREMFVTRPVQTLQQNKGLPGTLLRRIKASMGYTGATIQSSAEDLTHLHFFTRKSLSNLAAAAGFYVDVIKPSNFLEQVFPFSLFTRRSTALQRIDCRVAEALPLGFTSGFMSVWRKR